MFPKKSSFKSGKSVIAVVIALVLAALLVFGAYKAIPWFWQGIQSLSVGIRNWWHVQLAEPIFRALVYVFLRTRGQVVTTIAIISLGYWLFNRTSRIVWKISVLRTMNASVTAQEDVIAKMENVHSKLRKLFADDIGKIALFGGGRSSEKANDVSRSSMYFFWSGCVPSLLWAAISIPITLIIGIAVYDGVLRLFITPEPAASLLAAAGDNAAEVELLLQIPQSISLFGISTVHLNDRCLTLTAILYALGMITWFIQSISKSGWTIPRVVNSFPVIFYTFTAALSYVFLNTALLIFAISFMSYSLIFEILAKFLFSPLRRRAWSLIALRVGQGEGF